MYLLLLMIVLSFVQGHFLFPTSFYYTYVSCTLETSRFKGMVISSDFISPKDPVPPLSSITTLVYYIPGWHSILSWCWWNFLTSANQIGHMTGQGTMSPTWVGQVSDPGKNGSHKKYKNLGNIAVYLLVSLKSKWKNKQIKNMNNWIW